ncbi:hypothetical protein Trydic_g3099 [Trypoxylus dichotomus]
MERKPNAGTFVSPKIDQHKSVHHSPAQKRVILSTLMHKAKMISDEGRPKPELHLKNTRQQNDYKLKDITYTNNRQLYQQEKSTAIIGTL